MTILKWFARLVLAPVWLCLTMLIWVGMFLTTFSELVFRLLSGVIFLTGVACYLFHISDGAETVQTLALGFGVFVAPFLAEWLLDRLVYVRCFVGEQMR